MSPLSESRFVAQRELGKSFRSAKGIVLLVLSLLGGTAASLLLVKVQQLKREKMPNIDPESLRAIREDAATQIFGDPATGKSLADAPEVLIAVLLLTIWLTPLVISLLSFDSVAGDLQHKAVRYWTLRTRRSSYFIGKFLGVWATVSMMTLAMHALIWVLTLPMSAAWCAIATFVSSLFKSPIIALLVTFATFFVLFMFWLIGTVAHADALAYVYPNFYAEFLVNPRLDRSMIGLASCLGMAALYVGAGSFLFTKRDV